MQNHQLNLLGLSEKTGRVRIYPLISIHEAYLLCYKKKERDYERCFSNYS